MIVQSADFPLNDGGMFYAMVQDLQSGRLALPAVTSYNGLDIPFTSPPLAFYLLAVLQAITGTDLIELFRYVPLTISVLSIVAFYALSRTLLPTRFGASVATVAFMRAASTALAICPRRASCGDCWATAAVVEKRAVRRRDARTIPAT